MAEFAEDPRVEELPEVNESQPFIAYRNFEEGRSLNRSNTTRMIPTTKSRSLPKALLKRRISRR